MGNLSWKYQPENAKRVKRGETSSRRTRVTSNIPIPKGDDWTMFLKDSDNKNQPFPFLSEELVKATRVEPYQVISTLRNHVISNTDVDLSSLSPCSHEERDTRLMLHLKHAAQQGHTKAYIRTVDTDVVVSAIHFRHHTELQELWIGFGKGKTYIDIPIYNVCQSLSLQDCQALPFFHAFTGCDVTSSMFGIGKKK